MPEDDEIRFQRWANYIRKNVGDATDKILRYFWDLYSTLMDEIKSNNSHSNNNSNGKKP